MKHVAFFVLLLLSVFSFGQKKQVCFSFDDLPVVDYGMKDVGSQQNLMDNLIRSLTSNGIPAIGFVNEKKLYNDQGLIQFQIELLKKWANSSLDLGNHTFSHLGYNKVSLVTYSQQVIKGETIIKEILEGKGKSIRYFRHPFLHVGNSKVKADSLSKFLSDRGYIVAPVTIDNEDYLFAVAYVRAKAKDDKVLMAKIGHDFVEYMEKKLKYYEKQSKALFGRDIAQILLLHTSLLNSDYADSLITMFKSNGYTFVSMDKALEDSAYKTEVTVFGNWGISWIDRWALSMGKKGEFFKDEPITPDYINKLSE